MLVCLKLFFWRTPDWNGSASDKRCWGPASVGPPAGDLGASYCDAWTLATRLGEPHLYHCLGVWGQFVWQPSEAAWFVFNAQALKKKSLRGALPANNSERILCVSEQSLGWTPSLPAPPPPPQKGLSGPVTRWCCGAGSEPLGIAPQGETILGSQAHRAASSPSFLSWHLTVCLSMPVHGIHSRPCVHTSQ